MQSSALIPCPLCGNEQAQIYYRHSAAEKIYPIAHCGGCGLLYLGERPTTEELRVLYEDESYFDSDERGYETDYIKQRPALEREARRRLARINALEPNSSQSRTILDIGCAAGFFLNVARQSHWQTHGIEISKTMAHYARTQLQLDVDPSFEPSRYAVNSFHAITLWEVIEHLPDPLATLRAAYSLLRPGGVLALSTPNTGHWQAQRQPELWSEFKPPIHVIYFTESTLLNILGRAGFVEVQIIRTRPFHLTPRIVKGLHALRNLLGDGADPKTVLWPITSGLYRLASSIAGFFNQLWFPKDDGYIGLEAYARKPNS